MRLTTKMICGLVAALFLVPATASAKTHVAVGLGDQHASTFAAPAFRALHVKKARYFIRWDAAKVPSALAAADDYVRAANAAHVRVLLHISTNNFAHGRAKLPSTSSYRKWVGRLVRHYKKLGVHEFGVWNEENHVSQPTYKNARRAAGFYRVMRQVCHHCTIVALDVLDQRGVQGYISRWFRALPRSYRHRKIYVGIHNYSDTNRRRSRGTSAIIRGHAPLQPARQVLADRDRRRREVRRGVAVQRAARRESHRLHVQARAEVPAPHHASVRVQLDRQQLPGLRRRAGARRRVDAPRLPDVQVEGA